MKEEKENHSEASLTEAFSSTGETYEEMNLQMSIDIRKHKLSTYTALLKHRQNFFFFSVVFNS